MISTTDVLRIQTKTKTTPSSVELRVVRRQAVCLSFCIKRSDAKLRGSQSHLQQHLEGSNRSFEFVEKQLLNQPPRVAHHQCLQWWWFADPTHIFHSIWSSQNKPCIREYSCKQHVWNQVDSTRPLAKSWPNTSTLDLG